MSELRAAAVTLARALAGGGTIFCVAAQPMAGFVALSIDGAEDELRARSRSGDAVLIVGDVAGRDRILRRCPAWGVSSVWVGERAQPDQGLAAVCLLVPDERTSVAALAADVRALEGDTIALTPDVVDCTDEVCITCSDEGRIGEVVHAPGGFLPALVRTASGDEDVDMTIVGDATVHDLILIHAGSAIARVPDLVRAQGVR